MPDRILCVKKYHKITDSQGVTNAEFTWSSRLNHNIYRRVIKYYSAQNVHDSMDSNGEFIQRSALYGISLLYFPKALIKSYYSPRKQLAELYSQVSNMKSEALRRFSPLALTSLNICALLMEKANLELNDLGVTGSIMLEMDHDHSDIDLIVYGLRSANKILEMVDQLPMELKGLRSLNYSEILQKAQEYAFKYRISEISAFDIIKRKRIYLFYNRIPVSIKFNPLESEISNNPFALINSNLTHFETLGFIKLRAEIVSVDWQYFYPALIFIRTSDILEIKRENDQSNDVSQKNLLPQADQITRLVIFEQDLSGFLNPGDRVEIKGLLQLANNVPDESRVFPQLNMKNTFQVVVGTKEMRGIEYIVLF